MSQPYASLPSAHSRASRSRDRRPGLADAQAPFIAATRLAFPPHRHPQEDLTNVLERRWHGRPQAAALLRRLHASVGVRARSLALPLEEYGRLADFGKANDAFIRVGTALAGRAVTQALDASGLAPDAIDAIFLTTVTGVAAPSIDARLVNVLGLRPDVRRTPMFGLGCLGGAAGLARASDYLRAYPEHVAVLVAVELCSLTIQDDVSVANIIASGLFGDGAAAVVLVGRRHPAAQSFGALRASRARVVASRSAFFPHTDRVMGWDVGATGFKVVLSGDVPKLAKARLPAVVDGFLSDHGLERRDVRRWVCHPGGPKVISAIEDAFALPPDALAITRESLASVGNLSSASVLHVLQGTEERSAAGDIGLLLAMGPGFCAELVLLEWP